MAPQPAASPAQRAPPPIDEAGGAGEGEGLHDVHDAAQHPGLTDGDHLQDGHHDRHGTGGHGAPDQSAQRDHHVGGVILQKQDDWNSAQRHDQVGEGAQHGGDGDIFRGWTHNGFLQNQALAPDRDCLTGANLTAHRSAGFSPEPEGGTGLLSSRLYCWFWNCTKSCAARLRTVPPVGNFTLP